MKHLRWLDLIGINLFWLGINIRNNAVHAIYLPYLVELNTDPAVQNSALGFARSLGLIIAMLAQPIFGILSDQNTSKFGRRKPFIFFGVIFDILFILLFASARNYWFLLGTLMLIQLSSNASHGPMQALIPDLVPKDQRGVASSIKSIFELLPIAFMGVTIAALVGIGRFNLSVWITIGLLLLIMLISISLIRETPITTKPDIPLKPALLRVAGLLGGIFLGIGIGLLFGGLIGGLAGLFALFIGKKEAFSTLLVGVGGVSMIVVSIISSVWIGISLTLGKLNARKHASFVWWVVNRLLFLAAIGSIQSFMPYFMMFSFKINIEEAIFIYGRLITVVGIFTLLSALASGGLSDRIGQSRLVRGSGLIATISTLLLLFTFAEPDLKILYIAGVSLGIAGGLFATTNWALGTRLVPAEEAGRFLGISNIAAAGAGIIGTGLGGIIADYINRIEAGLGYFAIFAGFGLLFFLSIFILPLIKSQP